MTQNFEHVSGILAKNYWSTTSIYTRTFHSCVLQNQLQQIFQSSTIAPDFNSAFTPFSHYLTITIPGPIVLLSL